MKFERTFFYLTHWIIFVYLNIEQLFMGKMDMIRFIPLFNFVIPIQYNRYSTFIGFHLTMTIGCIYIMQLFLPKMRILMNLSTPPDTSTTKYLPNNTTTW